MVNSLKYFIYHKLLLFVFFVLKFLHVDDNVWNNFIWCSVLSVIVNKAAIRSDEVHDDGVVNLLEKNVEKYNPQHLQIV